MKLKISFGIASTLLFMSCKEDIDTNPINGNWEAVHVEELTTNNSSEVRNYMHVKITNNYINLETGMNDQQTNNTWAWSLNNKQLDILDEKGKVLQSVYLKEVNSDYLIAEMKLFFQDSTRVKFKRIPNN